MADDDTLGRTIANGFLAAELLSLLVTKRLITVEEARHVLQNAMRAAQPFVQSPEGPAIISTLSVLLQRFPEQR